MSCAPSSWPRVFLLCPVFLLTSSHLVASSALGPPQSVTPLASGFVQIFSRGQCESSWVSRQEWRHNNQHQHGQLHLHQGRLHPQSHPRNQQQQRCWIALNSQTQGTPTEGNRDIRSNPVKSSAVGSTGKLISPPNQKLSEYTWDVYVAQNPNKNKERGVIPFTSVIEAFISLSPSSEDVRVYPAVWNLKSKTKGKGHYVRCIKRRRTRRSGSRVGSDGADGEFVSAIEVGNVDSVDKVYRIMTEHMKLGEINPKACDCLRCYFQGNERLEEKQPSQAITLYNQALSSAKEHSQIMHELPKGNILMKRARAYLQRAANHRKMLIILVKDLVETVPSTSMIQLLYQTSLAHPPLASPIFHRLIQNSKIQQSKFRQTRYRHDMYEFALLHATQDSLQATQILPQNAKAWLLAGECLAELRKFKESAQYYQRAMELDPGMERMMKSAMERNRVSQEFMEVARASGFSGDTLRLALDVAA